MKSLWTRRNGAFDANFACKILHTQLGIKKQVYSGRGGGGFGSCTFGRQRSAVHVVCCPPGESLWIYPHTDWSCVCGNSRVQMRETDKRTETPGRCFTAMYAASVIGDDNCILQTTSIHRFRWFFIHTHDVQVYYYVYIETLKDETN